VSAEHEATTQVSGVVEETLHVEGEGRYYDDGWGDLTEATAQRDAEQDAERRLQQAAAESVARARSQAEGAAQEQTEARARARAETALAEATAAARADLDRTAAQRLEVIGARCREAFNSVLGMAYRDAILAYARSRRAHGVEVSQADGVLRIEFEMET
jgi:ATPase subunit of ABC transporter with duplicated ATPase domains